MYFSLYLVFFHLRVVMEIYFKWSFPRTQIMRASCTVYINLANF